MIEWAKILLVGVTGLVSVVDGDTLRMADGALVRLKGGNAPEVRSKCPTEAGRARERSQAASAATRLKALLKAKSAALVILPGTCGHGRHCGHLISGGKDAMTILISEGLAEPLDCIGGKCPAPRNWCGDT